MNDTSPIYESYAAKDDIGLIDIWQVLARYKWWVLGTPFVLAVAAYFAASAMPPVWEATAIAQVGQVGQLGQTGQTGTLIEPVARAIERMKLKTFANAVLARTNKPVDQGGRLFLDSLTVRPVSGTDLIEVKVRGFTAEAAKEYAEATVALLSAIHQKLAAPTIGRLRQQLAQAHQQIERTRVERDQLLKPAAKQNPVPSPHFMENIVIADILVKRDKELREIEQLKGVYEEQLGPLRTYPTSVIDSIYVSEGPVSPRPVLMTIIATAFGLLLGFGIAFVLNMVRTSRRPV